MYIFHSMISQINPRQDKITYIAATSVFWVVFVVELLTTAVLPRQGLHKFLIGFQAYRE